jgi:chromosome segregation ATPase
MFASALTGIMRSMLSAHDLPAANPPGLSAETAALVAQLLQRLQDQDQQLADHGRALAQLDQALAERDALLQRKDREIALREAKIEKITFELARLKRWKFGAKSEAMNAEQRRLFEETLAEDEAGLREQLDRLRVTPRRPPPQLPRTQRQRRPHVGRVATRSPSTCAAWNIATTRRTPTAWSLAADAR